MNAFRIFLLIGLLCNYVKGFGIHLQKPIKNIHMTTSYNNNYKLLKLQKNIENYLKKDIPIEKGIQSRSPIPKVPFDTIFLNIFSIKTIYITPVEDRIVIVLNNNNKYIYYSTCDDDKQKIRKIIEIVPNSITVIIITDIKNVFENDTGMLYSEK